MFVREKTAQGYTYLYLVESVREDGRAAAHHPSLGRKEVLLASGELERLAASLARYAERAVVLSDLEAGRIACKRIGAPLLFGRLWERPAAEGCGRAARRARFRVPRRARRVRQRAASAHGLRLGPRLREVDGRLRHPRRRRAGAASPLPRDGLARRGIAAEQPAPRRSPRARSRT